MRFADRREAGHRLGELLSDLRGGPVVVLGIPRGGVPVAAEVARALDAPLDVVVPRKIGAPRNPELALGAVAPGVHVLDERLVSVLGVTPEYLSGEIERQEREIERRTRAYRGGREPLSVRGRTAVIVDDGVATGSTVIAAARWVRANGAGNTVVAIPVGPAEARRRLEAEADRVVLAETPEPFYAVGQWYARFDQLTDEQVIDILEGART